MKPLCSGLTATACARHMLVVLVEGIMENQLENSYGNEGLYGSKGFREKRWWKPERGIVVDHIP